MINLSEEIDRADKDFENCPPLVKWGFKADRYFGIMIQLEKERNEALEKLKNISSLCSCDKKD